MGQIKRSIGNQCWSPEDWGTMRLKASTFKLLLHYYCCHYCFVTIQLLVRCQLGYILESSFSYLFLMGKRDKYFATLHSSITMQHLFLFNTWKIVLYQTPHAFFDCLFFSDKYKQIFLNAAKPLASIPAKWHSHFHTQWPWYVGYNAGPNCTNSR